MLYCMYSLELPQRTFMLKKNRKDMFIMPPDLALCVILIISNYPCLEHPFMVLKVFEPLKFDCISLFFLHEGMLCVLIRILSSRRF